jgi:hypothetical protein
VIPPVDVSDAERAEKAVKGIVGKRLTYRRISERDAPTASGDRRSCAVCWQRYWMESDRIKMLPADRHHGTRSCAHGCALRALLRWLVPSRLDATQPKGRSLPIRTIPAALAKFILKCFPRIIDAGNEPLALNREDVLLVMLSLAEGERLTPVQIQKSLFLADDKAAKAFRRGSRYHFEPYDYGPFDRHVYVDAQALAREGLAEIGTDPHGWNTYAATKKGIRRGAELRAKLNDSEREMLAKILRLVRRLSFTELVSAIYRRYPHMKARSVFRG